MLVFPVVQKKKEKPLEVIPIDLNMADSSDLIKLKGIGPVLARRILNFREALGGFYKVGQLQDVYQLPDSVFQSLSNRFVLEKTILQTNQLKYRY